MSDELLSKADALMRRKNAGARPRIDIPPVPAALHRTEPEPPAAEAAVASPEIPTLTEAAAEPPREMPVETIASIETVVLTTIEDDFPILTDIVDDIDGINGTASLPATTCHAEEITPDRSDAADIEAWLAERIPQLVSHTLENLRSDLAMQITERVTEQIRAELAQRGETAESKASPV